MPITSWARTTMVSAAAALAISALPIAANATPTGSIGITALGGATADTTDLTTATMVSILPPIVTTGTGSGDLTFPPATSVTVSNNTYAVTPTGVLTSITPFDVVIGPDTFTFDEQEVTVNHHTGSGDTEHASLTIGFLGSVSGAVTPSPDTASATFTFDQTGGAGAVISFAGTLAHPAQPFHVPEPATMALLGTSLIGLGFVRRRPRAQSLS